jgi:hypothetical protein
MVVTGIMPTASDMITVYKSVLDDHFRQMDDNIRPLSEVIVKASIELLSAVQDKFLPNSEKFMYQFNLREMTNIIQVCALVH